MNPPPSFIRLVVLGVIAALAIAFVLRSQTSTSLPTVGPEAPSMPPVNSLAQSAVAPRAVAPPAQPPSPSKGVDRSKPVFTRAGAILCPIESFNSPLEGHSVDDLMQMYTDPHDRRRHAAMQSCDVYQPNIQLPVPGAILLDPFIEGAKAVRADRMIAVLENPDLFVTYALQDGGPQFLVTRIDEVTNTP